MEILWLEALSRDPVAGKKKQGIREVESSFRYSPGADRCPALIHAGDVQTAKTTGPLLIPHKFLVLLRGHSLIT